MRRKFIGALSLRVFPAESIATELMTQWRHVVDSNVPLTTLAMLHAHVRYVLYQDVDKMFL